ncbi:acyltransferase family protein [Legionella maioricensis]|uniref:Acyltransferase n=1 Tax=Legionella maioricensis TaxID=2896528 RepID=A0A9X2IBW3_9GAMM|nr:acyltransferase family protein [Legionella maioricensis]MCL9683797.1 acyltransferase [Legionella maioricensis]MCL9686644.1 acyltransferase [Legionella maioricensis]
MKYRPDIDGLRAIAILLVLIYHGGLSLFPSGFVGVDVFFVISGFLITSIIHDSLNNDRFSFVDFYNRRLWRLQPVLVCLIFLTTIVTLLFFLPEDLIQYSRSARKTSLFISNLFFNQTTTGYFSSDTHQLPLLHTWSLSIEWQCYLILPLVLYGLYRIFSRRNVIRVLYALTFISFLLSLHYSKALPAQTYYQFSSRIFEFLIGSCIALIPFRPIAINKYILNGIGGGALLTIFYIATLNHILLGYPNWYAFTVCIATGLLIVLGRFYPTELVVKLLSLRPLVFIGMLSYSLYIWHWAVFSTLRYHSIVETPAVLLLAYCAAFLFAYLSWQYIEIPSRRLKQIKFRYTVGSLVVFPLLVIHATDYLIKTHSGFPQRFNQELVTIYQQLEQFNSPRRPLCISNNKTDIEAQCKIGAKNFNSKTGFMIGDSFSNHYWGFMDTLGQAANISILAQGTSSCLTLPGIALYDWWHFKNQVYQECRDQTEKYYHMIQDNHYDYVMIGQIWINYLSENVINHLGDERSLPLTKQRIEISLDEALKIITRSGAKPVLIKTTALMQENFHDCFFKHIKLRQPYNSEQCSFHLTQSAKEQWLDDLFNKMKIKYPELILIDPKKVQCQNDICKADLNGVPIYRDAGHLTDYASYQFGVLYLQRFNNPLS